MGFLSLFLTNAHADDPSRVRMGMYPEKAACRLCSMNVMNGQGDTDG